MSGDLGTDIRVRVEKVEWKNWNIVALLPHSHSNSANFQHLGDPSELPSRPNLQPSDLLSSGITLALTSPKVLFSNLTKELLLS